MALMLVWKYIVAQSYQNLPPRPGTAVVWVAKPKPKYHRWSTYFILDNPEAGQMYLVTISFLILSQGLYLTGHIELVLLPLI
jgi:hypothetical protein